MTAETSDFVLATFREIAVRFGLSGTHAARKKVKRLGWTAERTDPAGPLRIRVPRQTWDRATVIGERQRSRQPALESPNHACRDIESLERVIKRLRERLEQHGDIPPAGIRALTTKLEAARVQLTDLRLTAAIARTQVIALEAEAKRPPGPIAFPGSAVFSLMRGLWRSVRRRSAAAALRTRLRA